MRSVDGERPARTEDVDINRTATDPKGTDEMDTDFRHQPAVIRQQELRSEAAAQRLGRPDRMAGPDRPATAAIRIGWLFRRLAGPTPA